MEISPDRKLCLTIKEAADYSGLGENRIRKLIEEDTTLDWILHVGSWVRIKRKQFEDWIAIQTYI